MQHVLGIIDSRGYDPHSVQVDKLRKTIPKFSLDVLLCYTKIEDGTMEVVEDDDNWVQVKRNLKEFVNEKPGQNVVVQVLLSSDHLPPPYMSNAMSSDQVL